MEKERQKEDEKGKKKEKKQGITCKIWKVF